MPLDHSPGSDSSLLGNLRELWSRRPPGWPSQPELPFGEVPLTEYLRRWARLRPDHAAIVYYGAEWSYAELDRKSDAFAAVLAERGLVEGDRVGVFLPSCPAFLIAFWGVLKAGCVHVPVNPNFKRVELAYELGDAEVAALVTLRSSLRLVEEVRPEVPSLRVVITTTLAEQLPAEPTLPVPAGLIEAGEAEIFGAGDLDLFPALERLVAVPTSARSGELDVLAALNYTGGTTGLPKGCLHTQREMLYTAACARSYAMGPGELVTLCFLPVFWIAGENLGILIPLFAGGTCVLLARWDAAAALAAIDRYGVTLMAGVVESYLELLSAPGRSAVDLGSLRDPLAISFVTRLAPEHRQAWVDAAGEGSVLREAAWGMTETHTNNTSVMGLHAGNADLLGEGGTFTGLPMPGTEIVIGDFTTGDLLPVGEPGEILVRGPSVTAGYWRRPDATASTFRHGWLRTGDLGRLDDGGRLIYLGRQKEMLKVNGMSVFPTEVEALLARHPAVATVGVVGIDDPKRGQQPVAFIQLRAAHQVTADELSAWCRDAMASYKIPRIVLVDVLPLAPTGKIDKITLVERAEVERAEVERAEVERAEVDRAEKEEIRGSGAGSTA